jgi:hypothetical protein
MAIPKGAQGEICPSCGEFFKHIRIEKFDGKKTSLAWCDCGAWQRRIQDGQVRTRVTYDKFGHCVSKMQSVNHHMTENLNE